jgi:hypothetical protein
VGRISATGASGGDSLGAAATDVAGAGVKVVAEPEVVAGEGDDGEIGCAVGNVGTLCTSGGVMIGVGVATVDDGPGDTLGFVGLGFTVGVGFTVGLGLGFGVVPATVGVTTGVDVAGGAT